MCFILKKGLAVIEWWFVRILMNTTRLTERRVSGARSKVDLEEISGD